MIFIKRIAKIVFLFLISFNIQGKAQGPISPDRPGFSTGTHIIAPGSFQFELGYQIAFSGLEENNTFSNLPLTNLRFGIFEGLEINLMWAGINIPAILDNSYITDDLAFGVKYRLKESNSVNLSLLGLVNTNLNFEISPLVGLLWDYNISSTVSAFGVVQFGYAKDTKSNCDLSLGLAYSANDKLGIFAEYYNNILLQYGSINHNGSVGITYLLNSNTQLDAYFETHFSTYSYRMIGVGYSKKF
jgi:hypothetical protein